jgi:hypothetical protein
MNVRRKILFLPEFKLKRRVHAGVSNKDKNTST